MLEVALREVEQASVSPRHLEHVFALLALVLDPELLEAAHWALQGDDVALRGTALEYLDNVLPAPMREKLWPHLGAASRPSPSGRTPAAVRDQLLRSRASLSAEPAPPERP